MATTLGSVRNPIAAPRVRPLPERLDARTARTLLGADALAIFVAALMLENAGTGRIVCALVTASIAAGAYAFCGLYRRSYALHARDEAYYAAVALSLAVLPAAALVTGVAGVALWRVLAALAAGGILSAAVRIRTTGARRAATPRWGGSATITAGGWHARESSASQTSKRIFDLAVALPMAILAAPIVAAASAAILIESGRPVFFRQLRVGENGSDFLIFKLRTMRQNAGSEWAKPGDRRITALGAFLRRTSIDELPQLLNVIRGEMSIVGPRPEMRSFADRFTHEVPNYEQRHVVPPGLTGWAQLYLPRNLDPSDVPNVLPYDLFYVEHASRVVDAALVLKTGVELIFHRAV